LNYRLELASVENCVSGDTRPRAFDSKEIIESLSRFQGSGKGRCFRSVGEKNFLKKGEEGREERGERRGEGEGERLES